MNDLRVLTDRSNKRTIEVFDPPCSRRVLVEGENTMRQWTRWQDWVALAAGACALLSPLFVERETTATWTMVVMGALIVLASAYSLYSPGDVISEGAHAVLGLLLIISPWVMGFADMQGLAWTAWIAGAVTLAVGLLALPQANRLHHNLAASH